MDTPAARRARAGEIWLGCLSNNLSLIETYFAPEYELHVPGHGTRRGHDGLRAYVEGLRSSFPDLVFSPEDVVVDGDQVATRCNVTGTHLGAFEGMPATGKTFSVDSITISTYDGDTIREDRHILPVARILDQLGLIPDPGLRGLFRFGAMVRRLGKANLDGHAPLAPAPTTTRTAATENGHAHVDAATRAAHLATFQQLLTRVVDGGDVGFVDELMSPEFVMHAVARREPIRGPDEFADFIDELRTGFPDLTTTIVQSLTEGDRIVVRCRLTGTHLGPYMGLPPSKRTFVTEEIQMNRFDGDGAGLTAWQALDAVHILRQIDQMPAADLTPPATAAFLARSVGRGLRSAVGIR